MSGEAGAVASLAVVLTAGESRLSSFVVNGAAAADDSPSAAALSLPLKFLAHEAFAMRYFTAPERALPGEEVFGRSPDLNSDKDELLYRRGSRSLSGCSSGDSIDGCERDMLQAASWAAPTIASHHSHVLTPSSVDALPTQAGNGGSTAATHVSLTPTPPLAALARASLASPNLPSVNDIAASGPTVPWAGPSTATTSLVAPLPPNDLVTAAQVVWQAGDVLTAHYPPLDDVTPPLPPSLRFSTPVTSGAFPTASDARRTVFSAAAAAAEGMPTAPPASLQGAVRTQEHAWRPSSSRMPIAEQGQGQSALPRDDRCRRAAPSPTQGDRATGEWEAEEQEEDMWADNIFDEGGALHGAEVCLWLPRRVARCCFAAARWLRRFLGRRGMCVMICSPLDSASDIEGYDSGGDTDDSVGGEGGGWRGASGGSALGLGAWSRRRAPVCRPLLSGSTTHGVRYQPQRLGTARVPSYVRDGDLWSSNSEGERYDANDAHSSLLSPSRVSPSGQWPPGVTATVRRRELGEDDGGGRRRREAASADSMMGSPPCLLLPCFVVASSLRRGCIACHRAVIGTVAFYNVLTSHRTSEMQAAEAGAHGAANRHVPAGASSPPPHLAGHTAAVTSISATPTRPAPPGAHSMRQPLLLDISCVGQVFVLLQYVALAVLTATVLLLAVFSFHRSRVAAVEDETACNRYAFEDRIRPDLSFSLICFLLNGVLAVRYAVRAVRYEKGGLLVVQVVVVALQVCRAVYFLLVVVGRYTRASSAPSPLPSFPRSLWPSMAMDAHGSITGLSSSSADTCCGEGSSLPEYPPPATESVLVLTWAGVAVSVSLFVAASVLSPWVYASFGWRRYAQGIVQVSLSRVQQRLTVLRACVQLDGVITANAYLATVFLLDSWSDQRTLLLMTLAIFAQHYVLIPTLRRSRHWWPLLCAAGAVVTVSGYYAAVIGRALRNDHRLRSISSSPWDSVCYTDRLRECLYTISHAYPVTIFRDLCAADSADSVCLSNKQAEVAWQRSPPATARWSASPMGTLHSALRLSGDRDASAGSSVASSSFGLSVVPSGSGPPLQRVNNATDTYLPTYGAFPDYFRVQGCNEKCFHAREQSDSLFFERHIAGCCADYGQCRLKDDYRTYAVLLLFVLMIFSSAVRVVLLAVAWRRWVEEDDVAIELFVQEHCRRRQGGHRRRHRHPRQGRGHGHHRTAASVAVSGNGTPSQSPRRSNAPHDATAPATSLLSLSLQPAQNLAWGVEQYTVWRQQQRTAEGTR
ncbi:hypothetical protein LSCM1_03543 [Leishmania martiniquensis]|uniref:Uncharacterized protein n=1 Tax=Leishmania martiniquensis TaxID=1580590 RepID=A0A836GI12_9TRYP|nr:hypothetical protein LSCM1_03543 [Leishmania martiniquensis]